MVDQREFDKNF